MDLFCDVDGTLIDKDFNIRPFVKELFETAYAKGFSIFIWSLGGVDYARFQIERIFKAKNIFAPLHVIPKDMSFVKHKDWRSVCIDDDVQYCLTFNKWKGYAHKVHFYESTIHLDDHELRDIAEKL